MNVNKYQVFLKAVECGSFTRAAEELHFTQSGVSYAIQTLEEELGVPLLCRSRGGVTLTADGRTLLPYVQSLCTAHHRLENKARDLQGLADGVIQVVSFTSISVQWLPSILKEFQALYPHIEFQLLHAAHNDEVEEILLSGRADCGFLCLPTKEKLDHRLLCNDPWQVITAPDHPLAACQTFPLDLLSQEPFIYLDDDDSEVERVFEVLGCRPQIKYAVQEDQTILHMVSHGLGISIMPALMLENCPYLLSCHDLPLPFSRQIALCAKDESRCSLSTLRFMDFTCQWVRDKYQVS